MAMLEIKDLEVYYGVIHAIKGVSFEGKRGGDHRSHRRLRRRKNPPILHTITGLIAPKSGHVLFEGKDITKTPAHKIVELGMAHVPEGRRCSPSFPCIRT